ncbi:LysR family transcriptional regulator [Bordetella bronchiseptica]|uniref:LysR family transcriptional regulator n=1 Tax=Bordetella bronchiseptica TaxID=518 RepID=UPI00045A82A1|nr:LysR family transcriptional regulator [Bordetella bronchiseptica]KAK51792.1 LysR substrate-binding domain protein [Bordetella bronchiseptica OSU054]KDB74781.1 LysR substrate-binding domain protein [Bordetella bronchiseptica CA90 BB1334]KDD46690.1 LysR substrate-binding domain protein [Bordetella bronchiseptica OSU095]
MSKLKAMEMFVRVAELGSFSAVAQEKGIARSIVTRHIAQLEKSLGLKLITRSTRRLSLTSAGSAYVEKCREILDLIESAETELAQEHQTLRGLMRISLPLSYGIKRLSPLLLEFAEQHPQVQLEMNYNDRRISLIEEGVDLAVRITRSLADNDIARRIGTVRVFPVASPAYLARHGEPHHPSDLVNHNCLSYTAAGNFAIWQFLVDGVATDFPVRARLHSNNGDVLSLAAARGMGITYQPDFIVADDIEAGSLKPLINDFPPPDLGVYVMLPGNRQIPYRTRVLIDFLAERLATDH